MRDTPSILPLRARGVTFAVGGTRLVDGLDFDLAPGLITVLMGPNGAGKTLTLRLCHGLVAPTAGAIQWSGRTERGKAHAMVFQRPTLLRRSVRGNLDHAASLSGLDRAERRCRIGEALEQFALAELSARPARRLSGGEQQRLAIARAWVQRPQVLFLDEPTSALDPSATGQVEALVRTLHAEGIKIVMTTHDIGQARRLADEVMFLHRGRLLEQTPAEVYFEGPKSPEAQAFLKGELVW